MKRSRGRLVVSAGLFAAWIGYLAYLAATTTEPVVLSRSQFLVADLYVIADVSTGPAEMVTIRKPVWARYAADLKRGTIHVKNLPLCNEDLGWQGPGQYILALSRLKEDAGVFQITAMPRTPGFAGKTIVIAKKNLPAIPIYAATPETLRQLEQLTAEYHP